MPAQCSDSQHPHTQLLERQAGHQRSENTKTHHLQLVQIVLQHLLSVPVGLGYQQSSFLQMKERSVMSTADHYSQHRLQAGSDTKSHQKKAGSETQPLVFHNDQESSAANSFPLPPHAWERPSSGCLPTRSHSHPQMPHWLLEARDPVSVLWDLQLLHMLVHL